MPTVTANGLRMHFQRIAGTRDGERRPTVVFVHGLGIDSLASFYFRLAFPVSAAGFDVIAYDLRGHGRSERPPTSYTLGAFVADLGALLDELGEERPVHVVGNSFGGSVAFSYALARPHQVASVTLIESEPATESWSRKMASEIARAADQLPRAEVIDDITRDHGPYGVRLAKSFLDHLNTTTTASDLPHNQLLSREEISSVRCPVLGIFGAKGFFVDEAETLLSPVPNATTAIIPDQSHFILVEAPGMVLDVLLPWLAEQQPADLAEVPS